MFCIFFCSYQQIRSINMLQIDRSFQSFGFLSGGIFKVQIFSKDSRKFAVGLLDKETFDNSFSIEPQFFCNNISLLGQYSVFLNLKNFTSSFEGNISSNCILKPIVINCAQNAKKTIVSAKIQFNFANPNSYLDSRAFLSKYIIFAIALLFIVILIGYSFSFFRYLSYAKYLHWLIFFTILSCIFNYLFLFIYTVFQEKSDEYTFSQIISILVSIISNVLLFSTMILSASGWGILTDVFSKYEIMKTYIISTIFYGFESLLLFFDIGSLIIIPCIIFLIVSMLMIKLIIYSIKDAELLIKAHLLAISQA